MKDSMVRRHLEKLGEELETKIEGYKYTLRKSKEMQESIEGHNKYLADCNGDLIKENAELKVKLQTVLDSIDTFASLSMITPGVYEDLKTIIGEVEW